MGRVNTQTINRLRVAGHRVVSRRSFHRVVSSVVSTTSVQVSFKFGHSRTFPFGFQSHTGTSGSIRCCRHTGTSGATRRCSYSSTFSLSRRCRTVRVRQVRQGAAVQFEFQVRQAVAVQFVFRRAAAFVSRHCCTPLVYCLHRSSTPGWVEHPGPPPSTNIR